MALEVKFSSCDKNCKLFQISDLTGDYDPVTNPGGWNNGTSGPLLADVVTDELEITFPDGHAVTVILKDVALPFPNIDEHLVKNVYNTDLGINTKFPNGIYKFKRAVTGTNSVTATAFTAEAKLDYFIDCQAWCCVKRMAAKIPKNLDPCCTTNAQKKAFDKAFGKLTAAEEAFRCGDYNGAKLLLSQVEAICISTGCSNC